MFQFFQSNKHFLINLWLHLCSYTKKKELPEHETKQEGIFTKHEKLVLDLISGHQALLKRRFDQLCDSLTSVKPGIEKLKESLRFIQDDKDQSFPNISE